MTTTLAQSAMNGAGVMPFSGTLETTPEIVAPNVVNSGLYISIPSTNTDPGGFAIPAGAISVVVFFEVSSSDPTLTSGRVGFNASATAIGSLSATDTKLGYQPAAPVEYRIPAAATYIHAANAVAGAICRGMFLF